MAYPISAHSVKMKFPAFDTVPSSQIEFAIEEAAMYVDSTWGIYELLGFLYLTAHILTMQISRGGTTTAQPIISEAYPGVVSLTYAAPPQLTADAVEDLDQTFYGVRFKALRDAAVGSVAIV